MRKTERGALARAKGGKEGAVTLLYMADEAGAGPLFEPRRGADYVLCRDCRLCRVVDPCELPDGALSRAIGLCGAMGLDLVEPDEPMDPRDCEDYEPRP